MRADLQPTISIELTYVLPLDRVERLRLSGVNPWWALLTYSAADGFEIHLARQFVR